MRLPIRVHTYISIFRGRCSARDNIYDIIGRDQKWNVFFACNRLIANNNWLLISLDQQRRFIANIRLPPDRFPWEWQNVKFIKTRTSIFAFSVPNFKGTTQKNATEKHQKNGFLSNWNRPNQNANGREHIKIASFNPVPASTVRKKKREHPKFLALIFNLNICNLSHANKIQPHWW